MSRHVIVDLTIILGYLATESTVFQMDREDGEEPLESKLRKKMEASQRKLAQLQEHQANLVGMQLRVRERLNEARQAQQILLLQENEEANGTLSYDNGNPSQQQLANDADALETETVALRGKLAELKNKKKQMDSLVEGLRIVDMSDRASCSSDSSKHAQRDKVAELEMMKAQLAHLKGLMAEAMRGRDAGVAEPDEPLAIINGCCENGDEEGGDEEGDVVAASYNSFDRQSESGDAQKLNNSKERLTVEQIQVCFQMSNHIIPILK